MKFVPWFQEKSNDLNWWLQFNQNELREICKNAFMGGAHLMEISSLLTYQFYWMQGWVSEVENTVVNSNMDKKLHPL